MTFTSNGSKLMFNNVVVYQAPGYVEIEHQFNDKALVLYRPGHLYDSGPGDQYKSLESEELWKKVSRNVLMIDKDGNVLWRIQNHNYKNTPDAYLWARVHEDGTLIAYSNTGYRSKIDIETGKILDSDLVR